MRSAGRVLVVHDDPAVLEVLSQLLRAEGYAVATAADAGAALDGLWAAWDAQPDVILLDLLLPASTAGPSRSSTGPCRCAMRPSS
jgi:CheY-like chemotaxis protein